jgi:hypothetical protein
MERRGGAERAAISPTIARANGSSALAAMVERSLDALAPLVARLVADPAISAEAAMHVVVMNPRADPRTDPFETAILVERSFGDPARWNADYAWYARAKAQVSYREQASLRTLLRDHPERLRDDDIRVEGAVCDAGWTVAASGAQAWYDHAIATTEIALLGAAQAQADAIAKDAA